MKKGLIKFAKISLYSFALLFIALVVYANLEPAPMHAHVKPIDMTIVKVSGLQKTTNATSIQSKISELPGVTACTVNPTSELVSVTFDPDQTDAAKINSFVGKYTEKSVSKASFAGIEASGPQCPVPLSYIMAFERMKYALCFR